MGLYNIFIAVTTIGFGDMVVIDRGGGHQEQDHHDTTSSSEILFRFAFMVVIILILTLFSTLFEQLKQNNVQEVSKRISHLVNSMNQANSEYIIIGPIFSRQARDMINPCGRESISVMKTIAESPVELEAVDMKQIDMKQLECVEGMNGDRKVQLVCKKCANQIACTDVCPDS